MGSAPPRGKARVFGALGGWAEDEPFPGIREIGLRCEIGSVRWVSEIGTETVEYTRN
jgi:hypothetical protein